MSKRYPFLRTLYYQDKTKGHAAYEEKYSQRLNGETTIRFDFKIHGCPAFMVITEAIYKLTSLVFRGSKMTSGYIESLPELAIQEYSYKSLVSELMQTLEIENVHSTRKEVMDALNAKGTKAQNTRLYGMAMKYQMLVERKDIPLETPQDIRALYNDLCLSEVLKEDPENAPDGALFRRGEVAVQSKYGKKVHEGLFPEQKIIDAMEKALAILHDSNLEALMRIVVFHYLFGYIHPFYDGNGRMARFMTSYSLSQLLDRLIGVRLSYTIRQHLKLYQNYMFKETGNKHNRGDLTPFVEGFLFILGNSYDNMQRGLEARKNRLLFYTRAIETISSDTKWLVIGHILLQSTLFGVGWMDQPTLATLSKRGRSTVRALLTDPQYRHFFLEEMDGRRKVYSMNLDALEQAVES